MRRLLLLLFIIPTVAAFSPVEETIKVGETIEADTRFLELLSVASNGNVLVRIDYNTTGVVSDSSVIDGVNVTINETFFAQDPNERMATIIMTAKWRHLCTTDEDCNDGNACTINKCSGRPRTCEDHSKNITACVDSDGCCPTTCNWMMDSDCYKPCYKDRDCDDDNPGTIDSCNGDARNPGECEYVPNTECKNADDFCPSGCEYGTAGEGKDSDCSANNTCSYDYDCDDTSRGIVGACSGYGTDANPRSCIFSNITECKFNDGFCPPGCTEINDNDCPHQVVCGDNKCEYPETCESCVNDCGCTTGLTCSAGECVEEFRVCENIGERSNLSFGGTFYCSDSGWKTIKAGGSVCGNDYECKSEVCGDDKKCVSTILLKEKESQRLALTILVFFLVGVVIYLGSIIRIARKAKEF